MGVSAQSVLEIVEVGKSPFKMKRTDAPFLVDNFHFSVCSRAHVTASLQSELSS